MKQLASEGRAVDKILVAVYSVGKFLNTNSKNVSKRLHEKLVYQDILRFCCSTVANNLLPFPNFLNQFEEFLRQYETGSLAGQNL